MADSGQTIQSEREAFANYINAHGLKLTRQRETILDAFIRSEGHIDIEELYNQVKAQDSRIGQATVYRTMKLLVDAGLAQEHHFGDGVTRYEQAALKDHHDHMICIECNGIVEFENEEIERLQKQVANRLGFEIITHKLELHVRCLGESQCLKDDAKV